LTYNQHEPELKEVCQGRLIKVIEFLHSKYEYMITHNENDVPLIIFLDVNQNLKQNANPFVINKIAWIENIIFCQ